MTPVQVQDVKRYATSVGLYGLVVMPALWLFGGTRGVRLVAGAVAAGGAVTAVNTFAAARAQRAALAAPAGSPALSPSSGEESVIDVLGTTLGSET